MGGYGFPIIKGPWCNSFLKRDVLRGFQRNGACIATANSNGLHYKIPALWIPFNRGAVVYQRTQKRCTDQKKHTLFLDKPVDDGQRTNIVHYIGIAADEPKRIAKHIDKPDKILPLVQIGWDEDLCGLEATYMDMLAPTYTDGQLRDGCWFCHNQGLNQMRNLRRKYPDLWAKLMKLDLDSPVTFKADGHTVHDYDRRFQAEDEGYIDPDKPFRWPMLDEMQMNIFQFLQNTRGQL